jgi:hypothetical protein
MRDAAVTVNVTFRVRTRAAQWWVRLMRVARYIVGIDRAERWAIDGSRRLIKVDRIRIRTPR